MKHLLHRAKKTKKLVLYFSIAAGMLVLATGCSKEVTQPAVLAVTPVATGLTNPLGLEIDKNGIVWVAQQGSGANDGKVSIITSGGVVQDVITGFESIPSPGGEPDGPSHLLFANDSLYILGTNGKMYIAAVSQLNTAGSAIPASSLKMQNIGAFVLAYPFVNNAHDTHPYNFTPGPNGAIYITDAAANAILRRDKNGALSVVAEVPNLTIPNPFGPAPIEGVPTGIYYDGQDFYITTLTGFPFLPGQAILYKLTLPASGPALLSVSQRGFSAMVDIAKGGAQGKVILEHGSFALPAGWVPNTGRLVYADGTSTTVIADGLNQPAGLKQVDEHTWYVTNYGSNTVLKITN